MLALRLTVKLSIALAVKLAAKLAVKLNFKSDCEAKQADASVPSQGMATHSIANPWKHKCTMKNQLRIWLSS